MDDLNLKAEISKNDPALFLKKSGRCRNCERREGGLCEVLTCEELDRMDEFMVRTKKSAGQTIFTEGDDLDYYYNVAKGVIRIQRIMPDGRRTVLDFLYTKDFLGLNASGQYSYSAEAITEVELCAFPRAKLQRMFQETPKMESRLLGMYAEKLISSQNQLADLARKSPKERLATFLLALSKRPSLSRGGNSYRIPMTREDISDFLGLTIETVSRTFSTFSKEGLIKIDQRKIITLLELDKIRDLAEGS